MSCRRFFGVGLILCLVFLSVEVNAAALYVTSNVQLNPSATNCSFAAPCHPEDATRIAQSNLQDDTIILSSPSTFGNDVDWIYAVTGSEEDYDLTFIVQGGQGLIDGHGQPVDFLLYTAGTGVLTVDGFKIHNVGNSNTYGAALTMRSSGDLVIKNTTVINSQGLPANGIGGSGGADLLTSANVRISDSQFDDNIHGGLYVDATHIEIIDSSVSGNVANSTTSFPIHSGALLYMHTFDIRNTDFVANIGNHHSIAGGLQLKFNAGISSGPTDSRLLNNRFVNNGAYQSPSALSLVRNGDFISRIEIDRNQFSGNVTDDSVLGGAIYIHAGTRSRVLLRDNLMFDNSSIGPIGQSHSYGSAVYAQISSTGKLWLINNTIVENDMAASSSLSAAVHLYLYDYQAELEVSNNILYSNTATHNTLVDSDLRITGDIYASVNVRNNNLGQAYIYGGASSSFLNVSNTISSAPDFQSAASNDFHLANNSILLDAGYSSSQLGSFDIDGQARLQGSRVDIGADEFSGQVRRPLTLTKTGTGTGLVVTIPSGLSCESSCNTDSASFDDASTVGLVAVASADSKFVEWSGDCSGTTSGTQIYMYAPVSCTARFDPITYSIGVSVSGSEGGEVTSPNTNLPGFVYPIGGNYQVATGLAPGSAVSFTASVFNTGNANVIWENCATYGGIATGQSSDSATCTIYNVQSDMVLKAEMKYGFVLFPNRNLTVSRLGSGSGTVVSTPAGIDCGATCGAGFNSGTEVTLQAVPDADSLFVGWGNGCHGDTPTTIILIQADTFCHAVFQQAYDIDVSLIGNAQGTLEDQASSAQVSYPSAQQFLQRYTEGSSTELRADAPPGVSATFSNCENNSVLGTQITGNGTQHAKCTLTNLAQDFSFGLRFDTDYHVQTIEASGNGTGQVNLDPGGGVLNSPGTINITDKYGTTVQMVATGTNGSKIYWSNCHGHGVSKVGEGTSSSTCTKPLYNTNWVGVEFRSSTGGLIFKDGFEP